MFTVIFLSRAARGVFERSRTFFAPFEESGQIAFCDWNEASTARTVAEALPRLRDVIQGKAEWRAVVVDHVLAGDRTRDPENPFDFVDATRVELDLAHSEHSLVRIAHQLLGYPALTARDFDPVVSYRDRDGSRVEVGAGQDHHEVLRELGRTQSDVRVEYRERPYSELEVARHRTLSESYRMKEIHPVEVVFISTRAPVDEDVHAQLTRAWQTETEQNVSRFVERNDYPAASRFAVYDLLNPENSGYQQDELRFWLSVLTVAVNELPPSSFQAERVYRLDIDFSDRRLADLLNAHMSELTALRAHLDTILRRPDRPPELDVHDLLTEQTVHVQFEKLGGKELSVSTQGYGLASDEPTDEAMVWAADAAAVQAKADVFVRRPRRVLARAVYDAREKARSYLKDEHVLTEIDREELEEELSSRVRALTEPATTQILDRDRLRRLLETEDARVRRHIAERMKRRTIVAASLLVLAVWLAAFAPYVIQALGNSVDVALWSAFVVAIAIVVLAATGAITLVVMRRRLVALLESVNSRLGGFVAGVNTGASVFAGYLSSLATYMRAQALLLGADRRDVRENSRRGRLLALHARTVDAIIAEKEIVSSLGSAVSIEKVPLRSPDFDVDDDADVEEVFRFPVGSRQAQYNASGEFVDAPYDFISTLRVERARLFERPVSA